MARFRLDGWWWASSKTKELKHKQPRVEYYQTPHLEPILLQTITNYIETLLGTGTTIQICFDRNAWSGRDTHTHTDVETHSQTQSTAKTKTWKIQYKRTTRPQHPIDAILFWQNVPKKKQKQTPMYRRFVWM